MIHEQDGRLEFQFNGKLWVIDLKNQEEAIRKLVQLIVGLDARLTQNHM
jgi:hypothetical protein